MSGYTRVVDHYENIHWGRVDSFVEEFSELHECEMIFVNGIFYLLGTLYTNPRNPIIKLYRFYFLNDDSVIWELLTDLETSNRISQGSHQLCFFDNKIYTLFTCSPGSAYGFGDISFYFDLDSPENGFVPLDNQLPTEEPPYDDKPNGFFINYKNTLHFIGHSDFSSLLHYSLKSDGTWQKMDEGFVPPESHWSGWTFSNIRSDASHVVYNNKLYIVIESEERDEQQQLIFYSHLFYLDEENNQWVPESILPSRDIYQKSLFDLNGFLVFYNPIISGSSRDPITLYQYDYDNEEWIEMFDQTVTEWDVFTDAPAVLNGNKIYALNARNGFFYLYQDPVYSDLKKLKRACISIPVNEIISKNEKLYYKYENKRVKKAWVWGSTENNPNNRWLLALKSDDYKLFYDPAPASGLPYEFADGSSVIYNGALHLLGGTYNPRMHYSLYNNIWTREADLPFDLTCDHRAVVYDGKLQVLGGWKGTDAHYSWDGSDWTQESTLPYILYKGCVCVYNNKIHIIGGESDTQQGFHYSANHYIWDGTEWTKSIDAPYLIGDNSLSIVFDGKLRLMAGDSVAAYKKDKGSAYYHYSWDDFKWTREVDLYYAQPYKVVVWNNKLYTFTGTLSCILDTFGVWDWKGLDKTPYSVNNSSVINYEDAINIFGGVQPTKRYTWKYSYTIDTPYSEQVQKWQWYENDVPGLIGFYRGAAVVYNGRVHILGGFTNKFRHFSWDEDLENISWRKESTLPYGFYEKTSNISAVVYDDKIFIFGGDDSNSDRYYNSWDGVEWNEDMNYMPGHLTRGNAVVYRDQIHVLGIDTNKHYKATSINADGYITWSSVISTIPSEVGTEFKAVVWNNKIHIMGAKHYSWSPETNEWILESSLPIQYPTAVLVMGGYIHILGTSAGSKKHYYGKYVGFTNKYTWYSYPNLDVSFDTGSALVFGNDERLYLLGGESSENTNLIQVSGDGTFD